MSDWQVGDLALCVRQRAWRLVYSSGNDYGAFLPTAGGVYVVASVERAGGPQTLFWPKGAVALTFAQAPMKGFGQGNFRKVTPPKADEFDRETIALLNGQPAKRELAAAIDVLENGRA